MDITLHRYGDNALLINFPSRIEIPINAAVIALQQRISALAHPALLACVPAYCSLLVKYDSHQLSFQAAQSLLQPLLNDWQEPDEVPRPVVHIPVCYDDTYALDRASICAATGLSFGEVIELHQATDYRVFMLGFLPGFPYLGPLPAALEVARHATPRKRVPTGSVGLAGRQTGIYPTEAPGGWQIIGRTPYILFDGYADPPTLLRAGDRVVFYSITMAEYNAMLP